LDFERDLIPLLGVSRARARDHMRVLRAAKLVAWTSNGAHRYVVTFPLESQNRDSGASLENGTLEEEEEDSIKGEEIVVSSSAVTSLENETPSMDVGRILRATRALFGEQVTGPVSRYPRPGLLLAMIAQVWNNDRSARHPARLVYNRLKANERPEAIYLEDAAGYLPDSFLIEAGLMEAEGDPGQEEPGQGDPAPTAVGVVYEPEPSIDERPTGGMSVRRAFEAAMGQLRMEMPKAAFDTWVAQVWPVRFVNDTVVICCINAYARGWCESRLKSTFTRLLSGALNHTVDVEFVV
jgi:hypothetical protein